MPELPLLVPSYNRPGAPLIKLAQKMLGEDYPWWVFVRQSQARDYREAGLDIGHIVRVQDSHIPNLGETRNWMMRWALREGWPLAFDWDDDVFRLGRKLPEGNQKSSYRSTGNVDPWLDTNDWFYKVSGLATEVFEAYPGAVAGSVQNQRWCTSYTVKVNHGKTPRRTKILNVERLVENNLWCPRVFRVHGEDIGNTAMYLQYGWQVFTIGSVTYDSQDMNNSFYLPSTLRHADEELNRGIHEKEWRALQRYDIKDYLRVNKAYDDGHYMYGDVDWRAYRKATGEAAYTYDYTDIREGVPLRDIPFTTTGA